MWYYRNCLKICGRRQGLYVIRKSTWISGESRIQRAIIQLGESTATVAMAARRGVEPGRIAKTMSFLQGDKAVLIITEGTAKIDNRKYKDTFHEKQR
ncbi:MAG: homogentisate 1,2-dioxygenase domain-containing protein [Lachnospira eligens]